MADELPVTGMMDDIYIVRRALRFVHVEPDHNNAIVALERVRALLAALAEPDPLRQPLSMDAVEAALNSWWPDHDGRSWANGAPDDRLWYEKMARALAAAYDAGGR
jgi:hypothetical protein